jgi:hypothetical protein
MNETLSISSVAVCRCQRLASPKMQSAVGWFGSWACRQTLSRRPSLRKLHRFPSFFEMHRDQVKASAASSAS